MVTLDLPTSAPTYPSISRTAETEVTPVIIANCLPGQPRPLKEYLRMRKFMLHVLVFLFNKKLSLKMAVGKNKRLTKGKKGAKKKM